MSVMALKGMLDRIDELQAAIEAAGKLDTEVLNKINYKFRLDWNYYSNALEGNSLTKEETRSIMVNNITLEGKPIKDVLEIKGHDQLITDLLRIGKSELNLSEKRVRAIHKAIMHEDNPELQQKIGEWKQVNNHLINYKGETFDFLDYKEVPEAMHRLIDWMNEQVQAIRNGKNALHPAIIAFEFHLRYLGIHPFYDGNGRTARILTNLILISFGYPPVIINLEDKKVYYQYLADIQGYGGAPDLYYEFMCKLLLRSQELVLNAIEGKDIEEPSDLNKGIELLKRTLAIPQHDISKSPKVIRNLWASSFDYLIASFGSLYEKFKILFDQSTTHAYAYFNDASKTKISEHEERWRLVETSAKLDALTRIDILASFSGMRNYPTYTASLEIRIDFTNFNYKVSAGSEKLEKKYSENLSKKEIDDFLQRIGKKLLDQLNKTAKLN